MDSAFSRYLSTRERKNDFIKFFINFWLENDWLSFKYRKENRNMRKRCFLGKKLLKKFSRRYAAVYCLYRKRVQMVELELGGQLGAC